MCARVYVCVCVCVGGGESFFSLFIGWWWLEGGGGGRDFGSRNRKRVWGLSCDDMGVIFDDLARSVTAGHEVDSVAYASHLKLWACVLLDLA